VIAGDVLVGNGRVGSARDGRETPRHPREEAQVPLRPGLLPGTRWTKVLSSSLVRKISRNDKMSERAILVTDRQICKLHSKTHAFGIPHSRSLTPTLTLFLSSPFPSPPPPSPSLLFPSPSLSLYAVVN
ncbi:hypothetical protein C7M84_022274, partial [Penaeus vannamei]